MSIITNLIRQLYEKYVQPVFNRYWPKMEPYYQMAKSGFLHAVVAFSVILFCLYISAFLFGVIYYYKMPTIYQSYSLDFLYNRRCIQEHRNYLKRGQGVASNIYEESCYPTAFVDFDSYFNKMVDPHQAYAVYLSLDLPESTANLEMGMFMTTMKYGVTSSSQPATMRYRPFLIRFASMLAFWPLMLFDLVDSKQTINIPLSEKAIFNHHLKKDSLACRENMASVSFATRYVRSRPNSNFDRDSKSSFHGYSSMDLCNQRVAILQIDYPDIEIYSSKLHLTATFSGLQYLLFQWPVFSFLVGTSMFFVPVLASVLTLLYIAMRVRPLVRTNHDENIHCGDNIEGDPEDFNNEPLMHQDGDDPGPSGNGTNPANRTGSLPPSSSTTSSSSSIEMIGSSKMEDDNKWDSKSEREAADDDDDDDDTEENDSPFLKKRK